MSSFAPDDVANHLREIGQAGGIQVLWLAVAGERDPFKRALDGLLSDRPVVVLVVRSRGFDDPNALLADLVTILNESQEHCSERLTPFAGAESFQVVLLAKKELAVGQASSPVTLPSWFPILPNQSIHAVVRDHTWRLCAPVSDARTGIPELSEAVFALEGSLLRRLRTQLNLDPTCCNALFAELDTPPGASFAECLEIFHTTHRAVANPSTFRPSLGAGRSLVAQIWRFIQKRGTQELNQPSEALALALGLTDAIATHWQVQFTGLLFRPTSKRAASRVLAADIVLAVAFACQLSTAAAHSDEYPQYPVPLLTSFGQMLLATLSDAIVLVDALD